MSDVDDFYYAARDRLIEQFNFLNEAVAKEASKPNRDDIYIGRLVSSRLEMGYALKLLAIEKRRFTRMRASR